ncbi:MAG: VWA domain-containing protein [Endomicrobiaceae bacterium]|nr:VWA domain-containing protein [Endomicrobiaceae bacterium]MDD3922128.1 VWA domain-containing protein [Endomicrobiaceae bacterium]
MRFLYVYLLSLIPIILILFFLKGKYYKKSSLKFSSIFLFNNQRGLRTKFLILPKILILLGIILAILALARPQSSSKYEIFQANGIDIMLVIDTSTSMEAIDPSVNLSRIENAKARAKEFILKRISDRIGIVVFSGIAFTQCPLTLDKDALINFVDYINTKITKVDGTAIGNALATAVNRLSKIDSKSKIIILLTDGNNNMGEIDPLVASQLAKDNNIKIYTVGIGSQDDYYEVEDMFFGKRQVKAQGMDLDENLLKEIAAKTDGEYFYAQTSKELSEAFVSIDKLEKTTVEYTKSVNYNEQYMKFLIPAFWILVLGFILKLTVFKRLP